MKTRLLPLLVVLVLLLACASLPLSSGLGDPTPHIMCTAPACAGDETYACGLPTSCPGGCGTICVKKTPDPASPPTDPPVVAGENAICPIVVRTPAPEAPTATSNGTALPDQQVDPHVAVCATATEVAVGDVVIVTARAVDLGLPYFTVSLRPEGAADFLPLVEVTFDNQVKVLFTEPIGAAFVYTQAQGSSSELTLEFLAAAPGQLEVIISATGEIHYGYPGPANWGGGGSGVLVLTAVGP